MIILNAFLLFLEFYSLYVVRILLCQLIEIIQLSFETSIPLYREKYSLRLENSMSLFLQSLIVINLFLQKILMGINKVAKFSKLNLFLMTICQ